MSPTPTIYIPHNNSVLVVEDNQQRIQWFRAKLGLNTFFATTPDEAVSIIRSRKFDCIFLDHDAADIMVYDGANDGLTFRAAVREIQKVYELKFPTLIAHSMNPVGAQWIHHALRQHPHILPFGTFDVKREDTKNV